MFKKLKEKIAEEVKPLKIPQFAQSVVSPGSNTVVESPPNELFSLDDELPEDVLGNEGFSVVDLHHPSQPLPLSSGRFSRQSSMSSLASDASAFLPIHDASLGAFNMQDMESASEREDVMPQMNSVSKQELCNSYLKLYRHYQKYKGRTADLKSFCLELEKDNKKIKTVLLEGQEKSLRRMAELKEQCALEQHAKAHLEEALRNDLEEKDHLIQTLQTKIRLLKEAHSANSSLTHTEDESLQQLPGGAGENITKYLSAKNNLQTHQEQQTELVQETNPTWVNLYEESEIKAFKEKIDFLKQKIFTNTNVNIRDPSLKTDLHDFLNYISISIIKESIPTQMLSCKQEKTPEQEIHDNVHNHEDQAREATSEITNTTQQNVTGTKNMPNDSALNTETNQQSVQLSLQESSSLPTGNVWKTCSCQTIETKNYLEELENEMEIKNINFEKVTRELEASHEMISKQDSIISDQQNKLSSLQSEAEEASNEKKKITETIDALKCELVQTKLEHEEFQKQCLSAQCALEEKDQITKDIKDNLVQINQELEKACTDKSEMNELITKMETDLEEAKHTCKQLTQEIQNARGMLQDKELIIENMKKDVSQTLYTLNLANSQKNEANEIVATLKNELEETKLKLEKINNEYECISESNDEKDSTITNIKRELHALHRDLEMISSQKNEACEKATSFQTELKSIKLCFEEVTVELQSAQGLVKEKDLHIMKINNELTLCQQQLETSSKEKTKTDEMVAALQNNLTSAELQRDLAVQNFQSAQKMIDVKDSDILKIREQLAGVQIELESALSQNNESNNMIQALQRELLDGKSQIEELTQNILSASKLVEEKDCNLTKVTGDFAGVQKDLDVLSSCNVEKSKQVADLQNNLEEAKLQIKELSKELQSSCELINEKDLTIALTNKDLAAALNDLETTKSEKTETSQLVATLQNELMNMNIHVKQVDQDMQSTQQLIHVKDTDHTKLREEMSIIRQEVEQIQSERAELLEKVTSLENELLDVNTCMNNVNAELQSAHTLIEDKDSSIACLSAEVASVRKIADLSIVEKQETNEKMISLQSELANTKLGFEQVTQELQSADHLTKNKDLTISHLTEELTKVHKELDAANIQNTDMCTALEDLQHELKEMMLKYEVMAKEIEVAHQSIEEKNSNIVYLSKDLTRVNEELDSLSALKSETCEVVSTLQRELQDSRTFCDKVAEDLKTTCKNLEEKKYSIGQLKEELVRVKEELDITFTQKSQASENVVNLQCELKETILRLEKVTEELQSAHQLLEDKKLENEGESKNNTNSTFVHDDETLVALLQSEVLDNKVELEKLFQELECSHRIIEEKDSIIKEMKEELTDIYKNLNHKSDADNTNCTFESKNLENTFHLQRPKHFPVSSLSTGEGDSPSAVFRSKGKLCESGDEELCSKCVRNECSDDHSKEKESDRTVKSDIISKQSSSHNRTMTLEECSVVKSGMYPVSDEKVANIAKINPGCEELSSFVKTKSSEWCQESDIILQSNEKCTKEDADFLSQSFQQLRTEGETSNRYVPEPILTLGLDDNQINPLQFPGIEKILEEIQKENKEYGSLLECHKNIIDHLERITKVDAKGIQPGSAEWLHKQLVLLSQKLYDTKEKQRIQIASINKFVKHQEDLKKSGVNENHMTIEMQYLKNIVFQYMIGKETMLLAKVISAVMKFDQQQMDQVMQKELQKQTLLGQLGLL